MQSLWQENAQAWAMCGMYKKYRFPHKKYDEVKDPEEALREILHTILIESQQISTTMSFDVDIPDLFHPTEVLATFVGDALKATICASDFIQELSINSGCPCPIDLPDQKQSVKLTVISSSETDVSLLAIGFTNMEAIPVFLDESRIVDHPEHGRVVGFDLSCIEDYAGFEEIIEKQVQIRNADGSINTFITAPPKFVWRDKMLVCDLPTGYQNSIRVRYRTSKHWVAWSNWLSFTPQRKMTI